MRVEEALAAAGITRHGHPISDSWITIHCPECGNEHNLTDMTIQQNGQQTEYLCVTCEAVTVIVGPAPGLAGYRLDQHNVVRPLGGMGIHVPPDSELP